VLGELGVTTGNNYGRNDQINLYNAGGELVDRLTYGDQNIPGTIRTDNRSGQAPCSAIGQNTVAAWQLSTVGDAYGSVAATTGEVGRPGFFASGSCQPDAMFANGFEAP
jgi:hypothetical protein